MTDPGNLSLPRLPMRLHPVGIQVELENAGVSLGGQTILRGLTLSVGSAEVLGIAGPNGSGKTTLLRLLATLIRPDQGTGRVLGASLGTADVYDVRRDIGLIGHIPTVVGELSLRENLEHATRLAGGDTARIERALRVVGLEGAADRKVEQSSHGMLRRTEAARLLITQPKLLLLDEAFSGLDVDAHELIDALIDRTTAGGGSVVMVSHDASHLAERTTRVMAISAGRLERVA
jgi:heme exporter protein A